MKTSKRIKIGWAVFCTIVAIALCVAVVSEWKAQGVDMMFSLVAGCVGMFILGKEAVDFIDYWWFNGEDYYKGGKR